MRLPISEAAARLGVSPDTVRRRLKRGELVGTKQQTPTGFVWLVELPDETEESSAQAVDEEGASRDEVAPPGANSSTPRLLDSSTEQYIASLERELEARRREIAELHTIMAHQARALAGRESPMLPMLPMQPPAQPPTQASRRSPMQRLRAWIRGGSY